MFEPRTSEEILSSVEVVQEGPDHLVVADLGLLRLLLLHIRGHHCLHGGGPGGEDDAMAGEPLSLLTNDGLVRESLVVDTHLLNSSSWVRGSSQLFPNWI